MGVAEKHPSQTKGVGPDALPGVRYQTPRMVFSRPQQEQVRVDIGTKGPFCRA